MSDEKVLIHDLSAEELSAIVPQLEDYYVVNANIKSSPCVGCFSCWQKTPGQCAFKDSLQNVGAHMGQSKEVIVITKCCYGGYSPEVKRVFDRSISTSLPFFTYRKEKLHHPLRYLTSPDLTVYMYGDANDFEKEIAEKLVKMNAINMGSESSRFFFAESAAKLKEVWQ